MSFWVRIQEMMSNFRSDDSFPVKTGSCESLRPVKAQFPVLLVKKTRNRSNRWVFGALKPAPTLPIPIQNQDFYSRTKCFLFNG